MAKIQVVDAGIKFTDVNNCMLPQNPDVVNEIKKEFELNIKRFFKEVNDSTIRNLIF